jgi:hypothetical protein
LFPVQPVTNCLSETVALVPNCVLALMPPATVEKLPLVTRLLGGAAWATPAPTISAPTAQAARIVVLRDIRIILC